MQHVALNVFVVKGGDSLLNEILKVYICKIGMPPSLNFFESLE